MKPTIGALNAVSYVLGNASRDISMLVGMGSEQYGSPHFTEVMDRAKDGVRRCAQDLGLLDEAKE